MNTFAKVSILSSISISGLLLVRKQRSCYCDNNNITSSSSDALSIAIGETPLLPIRSLSEATGCLIYAKAEWLNPSGSVKDRAAKVKSYILVLFKFYSHVINHTLTR